MKKTAIILITIAVLGALGSYAHGHNSPGSAKLVTAPATAGHSATMAANTSEGSSAVSYKDGIYTGDSENTIYGDVQIAVVVSGGKIIDVNFLRMPSDLDHSQEVTSFSKPLLKQTTLQHQSANIDFVSGATQTSEGYQQSLQSALDQAAMS